MKRILAVVLLSMLEPPMQAQSPPSIQGVWRLVEITVTASKAPADRVDPFGTFARGTHRDIGPSLMIFTGMHYSRTTDTAAQPRPTTDYQTPGQPTVEELQARWGPFAANAGTYKRLGNTLTIHTLVAKEPRAQTGRHFTRFAFSLDGDILSLTPIENESGRFADPLTSKFIRVE